MKLQLKPFKAKLRPLAKLLAYSPLPPILLAASLVLSEYQKNMTQVYPKSLIIPLLEAIVIGLIPYLIFRKALRDRLALTAASLLAVPLFYDYEFRLATFEPLLKAVLPITDVTTLNILFIILLLVFCALIGLGAVWVAKRIKLKALVAAQFLIIMVAVAFAWGAGTVGIKLAALLPQMRPLTYPALPQPSKVPANKPDIYYIVLEDYANNDTLKNIYNYDNSPFLNSLTQKGFTVKNDMYSNYPYTEDSVPSTLQMNYLDAVSAKFKKAPSTQLPMRAIFDNPPIVQELKKHGYRYIHLGSWWDDTRKIPTADVNYAEPFQLYILGIHKTLSEFESNLIAKSVFSRFLVSDIHIGDFIIAKTETNDVASLLKYQLDSLKQITTVKQQGGRFIFAHILMPHPPYIYNADGSIALYGSGMDDQGASVERKYTNQIQYLNTQITKTIDQIQKNSKTPPVIILQSDEGPHPREMGLTESDLNGFDLINLSAVKLRQKYGILASYSLPGASDDAKKNLDSPVNAFRVVLNSYLNYDLPILPSCSYVVKHDEVLSFTDITSKLHGSEDSKCAEHENK